MSAALPDRIDPWRAVQANLAFAGWVTLAQMPRLESVVLGLEKLDWQDEAASSDHPLQNLAVSEEPRAAYRLWFGRDDDNRAVARGYVRAVLRLPCQRCLGGISVEVDAPLNLGLVRTDLEAADLPDHLDPWLVDDEELPHPLDLVEDELLLAVPQVPRHQPGECEAPRRDDPLATGQRPAVDSRGGGDAETPHPFAVLARLKTDRRE